MSDAPNTAVILAAGMGSRLRSVHDDSPKGLLVLHGEPLMARSVRLLEERGIERIVIVAGHLAEAYHAFARSRPAVEVVDNPAFATTGSMASLAVALEVVREDFLLLESDLVYEGRALDVLAGAERPDVVLTSGRTGAGDEVWVEAPRGELRAMSKIAGELGQIDGEFVGVNRISLPLAGMLLELFHEFERRHGHGRMCYETDALVTASNQRTIAVHVVPDLLWGEIDDEAHLSRVRDEVLPTVLRLEKRP